MNDDKNAFFITEEEDGTFSAIIKIGNCESSEDAQDLINNIATELGYDTLIPNAPSLH